jgi:hypothetical protein
MSKDIERTESENLPAQNPHNAFEAYGAQASQRNIVGQLLKFVKGRWKVGNEELEAGTRVIVNMASLTVGWQKWQGEKPVDAHMGLVSDNYQAPLRKNIGDWDNRPEGWEIDESSGKPRDPWQMSNMVVMRQLGTEGEEEGLFTYATSSRGGINAIGLLSKTYGKKIRIDAEALPIVELNADFYTHNDKKLGDIDIPVFEIVGWATAADVEDATETVVEETDEETGEVSETKTRAAPKKTETRKAAPAKKPAPGKKQKIRF